MIVNNSVDRRSFTHTKKSSKCEMCPIWAVRPKCDFFVNWNIVWTNYKVLFLRNRLHFIKFYEPIFWFCRSGLKQQVSISADRNRQTVSGWEDISIYSLVIGQNLVYSYPFIRSVRTSNGLGSSQEWKHKKKGQNGIGLFSSLCASFLVFRCVHVSR
jgi:hypothetical protein